MKAQGTPAAQDKLRVAANQDMHKAHEATVKELNAALATELICVLRYKSHAARCEGILGSLVRDHFLEHAEQEQKHSEWIAERISNLGGTPEYDPSKIIALAHVKFETSDNVAEMVAQNLRAERTAIEKYRSLILTFGNQDAPTRAVLEKILVEEEEHAEDMPELQNDPMLEKLSIHHE